MRIGIITFHWATNYGAVLQCYALQETLKQQGHEVSIINYKPRKYDNNIWTFFRMRKFTNLRKYAESLKKERLIQDFRRKYLNMTNRYYSIKQLNNQCNEFDAIISGSDQVLNISFLRGGERGGSTAYYLNFGKDETLRICYAVSFGTTSFPNDLIPIVTPLVKNMNAISCRENTGMDIFNYLGVRNVNVVPDPTFLIGRNVYQKLVLSDFNKEKEIFVYMLHGRYNAIKAKLPCNSIISSCESIEEWLTYIKNAKIVVTNSFHGTVFCIHFHVPFYVVLPTLENIGMNDRFYTMLGKLGLSERILSENEFKLSYDNIINWEEVEDRLSLYREEGLNFLNNAIIDRKK